MSIYIKGMEMPVSCTRCPLSDDDVVFCHAAKKYIPMLGNPTFCPLIEVTDHGELIDRDALITHMKKDPLWKLVDQYGAESVIEAAPTIIPADMEADDGET